jgi:hypothetical protein
MPTNFIALAATVLLLTASAAAQQEQQDAQQAQTTKPQAAQQQQQSQKVPPNEINPIGQPVNIKLDLTITDQSGAGEPAKKTVSVILADRANGSVRTGSTASGARLNVDAQPLLLPNGNIRLSLGVEYSPRSLSAKEHEEGRLHPSVLNERIVVVLEPGKPLMISQAADAASDRKTTVEVRVTLIK